MDGEISPAAVEALLDQDGAGDGAGDTERDGDGATDGLRIVDIRSARAFEDGHVPGSECIPFAELPRAVDRLDGAERVVTVCPHGKASVRAARLVGAYGGLADGARVESMAGGLEAWEGPLVAADGPGTETGSGPGAGAAGDSGSPNAPF